MGKALLVVVSVASLLGAAPRIFIHLSFLILATIVSIVGFVILPSYAKVAQKIDELTIYKWLKKWIFYMWLGLPIALLSCTLAQGFHLRYFRPLVLAVSVFGLFVVVPILLHEVLKRVRTD